MAKGKSESNRWWQQEAFHLKYNLLTELFKNGKELPLPGEPDASWQESSTSGRAGVPSPTDPLTPPPQHLWPGTCSGCPGSGSLKTVRARSKT